MQDQPSNGRSGPLTVFFDLEGPLSPQDNAYEVMGLLPQGHALFAVISRYDDLLALANKPGYEPGDTLALILPFLAAHGLTATDIRRVSQEARLVEGAEELLAQLHARGWSIYIISTSYAPHAHRIAETLHVPPDRVACTSFPAGGHEPRLDDAARELVHRTEKQILELSPPQDDTAIQVLLDHFYWEQLPTTRWGDPLGTTQVMGGRRKADAARNFSRQCGHTLAEAVAVGDSITDAALLQAMEEAGGLGLAFNANSYALSHATAALASTSLQDVGFLLSAWEQGGRRAVMEACAKQPNADWLAGRDLTAEIIERHGVARRTVRGQAAALG
jgi:energy-converting hydrogenase A subunit R